MKKITTLFSATVLSIGLLFTVGMSSVSADPIIGKTKSVSDSEDMVSNESTGGNQLFDPIIGKTK